jgi:O-antigen ligase
MLISYLNKIKKYITEDIDRFLILCLVFSLPFDRIPSIELFGVTLRFSILFGALLIVRATYLIIKKRIDPSLRGYEKILLIFIAWLVLIIPESINITKALTNVISNIFVILMSYSFAVLFKKNYIKPIIYSLFISAGITVAFGLYQYVGDDFGLSTAATGLLDRYTRAIFGFPRIQAFSLEPLYFASYLLLPFSAALALYLNDKQKIISNKIGLSLLFLYSFGIFMTVSRGGIYGLVACLLFLLGISWLLKTSRLKKTLLIVFLIVLSFGTSLLLINYLNKTPSGYTNGKEGANAYVTQIKNTGLDKGDERAKARAKAITIIKENKTVLFLGLGPGQYGPYVQNNRASNGSWTIVNNLFLELLVETGVVGLLLIMTFIAFILYKGIRYIFASKDIQAAIIALTACGYLVSQAVQYQSYSTLYIVHLWVAIALLLAVLRQNVQKK